MQPTQQEMNRDFVAGRNSVLQLIKSGQVVDHILVARGERGGSIRTILALCAEKGIVVKQVDSRKLDALCGGTAHQGIGAWIAAHAYASVEDILQAARARNEAPFVVVCDEVQDPHNLGAVIRTAEGAGAHGVILPKWRAAGLTTTVAKTASGALSYLPVARAGNIAEVIDQLKQEGLWIYGADMAGECYNGLDLTGPLALVIGSEGKGLKRLVREKCDFLVSIPMRGQIQSLNASVAAGILLYEVVRQRSSGSAPRAQG